MPRAHRHLLGAYRRYSGREDPLTELLATTLEAYPPFAAALFAHPGLGLPAPARAVAATQVRTDEGRRVDLQVLGLTRAGAVSGRLWSENKTGAAYQPDQLGSYLRSLSSIPGDGRLITIVPAEGDAIAEAAPLGVPVLTWQRVADLAFRAAAAHEKSAQWRAAALDPAASAGLRLLEELISYLEEDQNVTLDPLRFEHIRAFQLANETSEILTELLARTPTNGVRPP